MSLLRAQLQLEKARKIYNFFSRCNCSRMDNDDQILTRSFDRLSNGLREVDGRFCTSNKTLEVFYLSQEQLNLIITFVVEARYFTRGYFSRQGRLGMIPGSVHCVSIKKTIVKTTASMNRMGMAGLHAHMVGSTKIQYRIKQTMKQPQTQKLAQVSVIGPTMHPQGRNRFLPGQVVYILAMIVLNYVLCCTSLIGQLLHSHKLDQISLAYNYNRQYNNS